MSTRTPSRRDADLRRKLVELGIRVTEQRILLLQELSNLRAPISHPELTERMSRSSLDRATIYRNLLALTDAGLLVRTQLGDNVWRYEMPRTQVSQHRKHPHFVCTDCGQVACLPEDAVQMRNARMRARVVEVQLRGLCPACDRG